MRGPSSLFSEVKVSDEVLHVGHLEPVGHLLITGGPLPHVLPPDHLPGEALEAAGRGLGEDAEVGGSLEWLTGRPGHTEHALNIVIVTGDFIGVKQNEILTLHLLTVPTMSPNMPTLSPPAPAPGRLTRLAPASLSPVSSQSSSGPATSTQNSP